jgi:hypothetical protein
MSSTTTATTSEISSTTTSTTSVNVYIKTATNSL